MSPPDAKNEESVRTGCKYMAEQYLIPKATLALKRLIKISDPRGENKKKAIDTPKIHAGRVSVRSTSNRHCSEHLRNLKLKVCFSFQLIFSDFVARLQTPWSLISVCSAELKSKATINHCLIGFVQHFARKFFCALYLGFLFLLKTGEM